MTLNTNNLPSHSHSVPSTSVSSWSGSHSHVQYGRMPTFVERTGYRVIYGVINDGTFNFRNRGFDDWTLTWEEAKNTETTTINVSGQTTAATTTGTTGNGSAINVMNPYYVVNIFERTA